MSARTIIAAPVIWFGSWLWLLIGLLRMRISWRGLRWSGLWSWSGFGNKKGPEEAPCAPPAFGMASATRGDAPGYDDRSEERRVGKECRSRGARYQSEEKENNGG